MHEKKTTAHQATRDASTCVQALMHVQRGVRRTQHPMVHQCERVGLGEHRFKCVTTVPAPPTAPVPAPAPATAPASAPAPARAPSLGCLSKRETAMVGRLTMLAILAISPSSPTRRWSSELKALANTGIRFGMMNIQVMRCAYHVSRTFNSSSIIETAFTGPGGSPIRKP